MKSLEIILMISVNLLLLMLMYIRSKYFIHMAQQLGYIPVEYKSWLQEHPKAAFSFKKGKTEFKKPLVYTPRVKRLFFTQMFINFLPIILLVLLYFLIRLTDVGFLLLVLGQIFIGLTLIFYQNIITGLSLVINSPFERLIHKKFYKQAQKKILSLKKNDGLKVVGITGSYGKTSTKMVLYNMLKDYIPVYTSPESYNTPMGLSKVINDELSDKYKVFIAEMGARYEGEIKELTDLVYPDIGVLTNIGPCHLETFGSQENIIKTKFELADATIENGILIVNLDNEFIKNEIANRGYVCKTVSLKDSGTSISAEIISCDENGTKFNIKFPEAEMEATTKLLGEHNIINILLAVMVAREFGISNEDIVKAIANLPQVEHRLNLIKNNNGLIIIDDAFNSNPDGARAAIKVLNSFKSGKRVIVTPGMVELGDKQYEENYALGQYIANHTDISILVGTEIAKPIKEGIENINNKEHVSFQVKTLNEATALFPNILTAGDIVLFENDLTDIYE